MESMSVDELKREFPVVISIPVAWGEMDAFGHVNNAVYFRYFETARSHYLEAIGFRGGGDRGVVGPILASTHCRFRRPLVFPDTVQVGVRAKEVGEDRIIFEQRIVSEKLGEVAAIGEAVVVSFDYGRSVKAPVPESVRRRIEEVQARVAAAADPGAGRPRDQLGR